MFNSLKNNKFKKEEIMRFDIEFYSVIMKMMMMFNTAL